MTLPDGKENAKTSAGKPQPPAAEEGPSQITFNSEPSAEEEAALLLINIATSQSSLTKYPKYAPDLASINEKVTPVKAKGAPKPTNTDIEDFSTELINEIKASEHKKIADRVKMHSGLDKRPELNDEDLTRIVTDVKAQIEIACTSYGYFDESFLPVTGNAYVPTKQPTGVDLLVGRAKVDACLFDPLKNFELISFNFLRAVDSWGARGRHMETVTIPYINRVLRGVRIGNEESSSRIIHKILERNEEFSQRYINTFIVYAEGLENAIKEMRGLIELLFQICDQGNELKEEFLGYGDLPRPSTKSKASNSSSPKHGQGKPVDTKAKSSSNKTNVSDVLAAALTAAFGPTPEPIFLRTSNRNISSITFGPEPDGPREKYDPAKGPTDENLANMTMEEYNASKYDQDFYAVSPEFLAALSGTRDEDTRPMFVTKLTRAERVKALETTPGWKKMLSDRHYIESLHVGSQELDIFGVALGLAKEALERAEECLESVKGSQALATQMMANYEMYKEHADQLEDRVVKRRGQQMEVDAADDEFETWCPEETDEMLGEGEMGRENEKLREYERKGKGKGKA
ncbi:hypothetical protein P7C71_g566, partial [Lecanoromycetidae sp. Uapishka_2]